MISYLIMGVCVKRRYFDNFFTYIPFFNKEKIFEKYKEN